MESASVCIVSYAYCNFVEIYSEVNQVEKHSIQKSLCIITVTFILKKLGNSVEHVLKFAFMVMFLLKSLEMLTLQNSEHDLEFNRASPNYYRQK